MAVLRDHLDATLKSRIKDSDGAVSNYIAIYNNHTKITDAEVAALVTPTDYAYPPGDIRRYGAVGDNSTDNYAAIQAAINVAENGGGDVYIPAGIFRFGTKLSFSAPTVLARSLMMRGDSVDRSILRKSFIGTGIEISNFARPAFFDFTLDLASGVADTGVGILVTKAANQWSIRNVMVTGQGSHGVEVIEANLCTMQDVLALSNGGDGLKLNGASTPDVNACTLINIDARGNTGWGVNFSDAWSNFGFGITTQSNTAGGVRLDNARQNSLHIYSESNGGPQIELVNNAECKGNFLTVVEGGVTYGGTTAARNTVLHTKRGPTFDPNFSKVTADKFILQNELQNGTEVIGVLTRDHTANNRYDVTASGGGASGLMYYSNAEGTMALAITGRFYIGTPTEIANSEAPGLVRGSGTPESSVNAPIGSIYMRTDGGAATSIYVKESGGGGSTGWVAK
jgi:hypothetical protein